MKSITCGVLVAGMHIRIGWVLLLLAAAGSQPVLSANLKFVDGDGKEVLCGSVSELTVTNTDVTATGTDACLSSTGSNTPVAATHNMGVVNTNSSATKKLTDGGIAKLPLPASPVSIIDGPDLPGATVGILGESVIYYAPSFDQISASADDSFAYTLTDATGIASEPANVAVHVNWIDQSDGCHPTSTIACKGEIEHWPEDHDTSKYIIERGKTHVWTFVYNQSVVGKIGATLWAGSGKTFKISKISGDTKETNDGCWVTGNDYVSYEPIPGSDKYKCDLVLGQQYYFNIINSGAIAKYFLTATLGS